MAEDEQLAKMLAEFYGVEEEKEQPPPEAPVISSRDRAGSTLMSKLTRGVAEFVPTGAQLQNLMVRFWARGG
jgi:hypothetical protein